MAHLSTDAGTDAGTDQGSLWSRRGFVPTYAVGVVWSLSRWAIGFLGAYVVADTTGSPRLVQLTGAMLWAPLLFAGAIGGALSDRLSRRGVLLAQFAVLGPLTALVGMAALADRLELWMLYTYMVLAGCGWVIDMTVRRALVYDLVGDGHVNRAMAFEGLASSVGLAAGALAGGTLIGLVGAGGAYLVVAGAIAVAAVMLMAVPATGRAEQADAGKPSLRSEIAAGLRLLPAWPALASILGVTALTNFFHFSYFPIVPVIAQLLEASPMATGALAAATGLGMGVGALVVLRAPTRRGLLYVAGSIGAFAFLVGFAAFDSYWLVFASLFAASCFVGMFGATQSALVMTAVGADVRGRAMGLLSMAIGMLPIGMATLGEVAEVTGPRPALIASNLLGLAAMAAFLARRPEVLRIR